MGASFSSSLIAGVRVGDIYKVENVGSEVTKYNPDTGKPYQTKVVTKKHLLCGKEIEAKEDGPPEWLPKMSGLDVSSTGNSAYEDKTYSEFVVGVQLGVAGGYRNDSVLGFPAEKIANALAEAKEKLAKLGYNGKVELFLVHYCGY